MVLCGSARLLSQPACIAHGLRSGLRWLKDLVMTLSGVGHDGGLLLC